MQQLCSVIIQHFLKTRAFFSSWGRGFLGYPLPFRWDICSPGFIQGSWWDSSVNVPLLVFRAWINRDITVKLQLNPFVAQKKKDIDIKKEKCCLCWGAVGVSRFTQPWASHPKQPPGYVEKLQIFETFYPGFQALIFIFFCVLSLSRLCSANFDPRWWNRAV